MPGTNIVETNTAYTYEWSNAEQTVLERTDESGKVIYIPTDPNNTSYALYLSSNAEAASYVPPEPPPEKTTEEKVDNMLAAYGLSREEMRAALAVKTE